MTIDEALAASSHSFDLTEASSRERLTDLAELLMGPGGPPLDDILEAAAGENCPLEFRLAAKLVVSRRAMLSIEQPLHVGVVFAMWGESARLQKKAPDNPHGEDALKVKLDQLEWICRGTPVQWTLYAVDDGDPDDCGTVAAQQAASHRLADRCRVLWLEHALPANDGPLRRLLSADDSRKGGAVIFGALSAIDDGVDAIVYTDADNSVHLGQLGLLIEPYVAGAPVVIGNRKHKDSVLVKASDRWGEGIKTLRHIQRMVGDAIFSRGLSDTQAAFKLYDARLLEKIIQTPSVFDFSFDTDWLASAITQGVEFHQVPFAFIDSESESASAKQNPMTTWEVLLFGMLRSLRRYDLLQSQGSREMARVLDEEIRDHRDLEKLIDVLPEQLREAGESDYGNPAVMSPEAMANWIQKCCRPSPARAARHAAAGSGRRTGI